MTFSSVIVLPLILIKFTNFLGFLTNLNSTSSLLPSFLLILLKNVTNSIFLLRKYSLIRLLMSSIFCLEKLPFNFLKLFDLYLLYFHRLNFLHHLLSLN